MVTLDLAPRVEVDTGSAAAPALVVAVASSAPASPTVDARRPIADQPPPAPVTEAMAGDAMVVATDRLGAVRLAIDTADGLAVALSVDRGPAAALLTAAADRLDSALAAGGQRLDTLSVDVRSGDGGRRPPTPAFQPPTDEQHAAPSPAARSRRDRYA